MSGEMRESTYIERVAQAIWWASGEIGPWYPANEAALWLGYAVLCIAKGSETTSSDVHQAWSAWAVGAHGGVHRSLIPFGQLSPEVQAYDDWYRDAIRDVSELLGGDGTAEDDISHESRESLHWRIVRATPRDARDE